MIDRAEPTRSSHRLITGLGGLAFATLGLETAILSFAVLGVRAEWGLSPKGVALILAAPGVGQLLGAGLLGALSDRLGRRAMYCLSVGLLAGFSALGALAPSPVVLAVLLALGGLGQGGASPVVVAMVAEAAPIASRGRMVAITELMWATGFTAAAVLGQPLAHGASWRLLVAAGGLPLLLVPLGAWLLTPAHSHGAGSAASEPSAPIGVATLWSAQWRRATIVLSLLWLTMFGVFYGPVLWLPTLFATANLVDPARKGVYVAIGVLAGASAVVLVIDRVGRRPLLILACAAMALACGVLALAGGELQLVGGGIALGFILQFVFPVSLTYSAEMFATPVRGLGVGWAMGAGRVATFVAPAAFGTLVAGYGRPPSLLVFAVIPAAMAVVIGLAGPETAGRELSSGAAVGQPASRLQVSEQPAGLDGG